MPARKRHPARPASAPLTRAASRARRWARAGRELERCDPGRHDALLLLAERILRAHRTLERSHKMRARDLKAEIRARFAKPGVR